MRRGRRLVTLDPSSSAPACEIATPTLAALEWAQNPQKIELSPEALAKMQTLTEAAPAPSPRLRTAAKRHLLGYSLAKRFTWAAHAWLCLALALASGGAWLAMGASPNLGIVLLMVAVITWLFGFDVLYALQDEAFDRLVCGKGGEADLAKIPKAFFDCNAYVSMGFFAATLIDALMR